MRYTCNRASTGKPPRQQSVDSEKAGPRACLFHYDNKLLQFEITTLDEFIFHFKAHVVEIYLYSLSFANSIGSMKSESPPMIAILSTTLWVAIQTISIPTLISTPFCLKDGRYPVKVPLSSILGCHPAKDNIPNRRQNLSVRASSFNKSVFATYDFDSVKSYSSPCGFVFYR